MTKGVISFANYEPRSQGLSKMQPRDGVAKGEVARGQDLLSEVQLAQYYLDLIYAYFNIRYK